MDRSSYGLEGAENTEGTRALKMYFEKHPQYPPQPRQFPTHHIDVSQAPEDQDRGVLHDLGGLATNYGLALGVGAFVLCLIHPHGWPF